MAVCRTADHILVREIHLGLNSAHTHTAPPESILKIVQFIIAHNAPQAGKPVFVNPENVGFVIEGHGSKDNRPVTAIYIGSFPILVSGGVDEALTRLGFLKQ